VSRTSSGDGAGEGRIAVFGGVYSNHLALKAVLTDARARGAAEIYCLGDLGAFGPCPDKIFPVLVDKGIPTIRGNYDDSIARGLDDCQCGYTDPRDNHFARLSYRYTLERTSPVWRDWMAGLPEQRRIRLAGRRALMCHGSPRRINEFLWESTCPTHFLEKLCSDADADILLCTHTGLHWSRGLSGGRLFVNVGVIGRPANDGDTRVWYTLISATNGSVDVEFVPVAYDHRALAHEMEEEGLPREFIETILTGWWTTCNEILPMKERRRGIY
jgi:diadenosine tetraphosphatase ApaH/serine/threonine PP2A family protein phosphatase